MHLQIVLDRVLEIAAIAWTIIRFLCGVRANMVHEGRHTRQYLVAVRTLCVVLMSANMCVQIVRFRVRFVAVRAFHPQRTEHHLVAVERDLGSTIPFFLGLQ